MPNADNLITRLDRSGISKARDLEEGKLILTREFEKIQEMFDELRDVLMRLHPEAALKNFYSESTDSIRTVFRKSNVSLTTAGSKWIATATTQFPCAGYILWPRSVSGYNGATPGVVGLGTTTTANNLVDKTKGQLDGLSTNTDYWAAWVEGLGKKVLKGTNLYLNVGTAVTATTFTVDVDILGYTRS